MKIIINDIKSGKTIIPMPAFLLFGRVNKYLAKKGAPPISSGDIEQIKRVLKKYSSLKEEFVLVDVSEKDGSSVKVIL